MWNILVFPWPLDGSHPPAVIAVGVSAWDTPGKGSLSKGLICLHLSTTASLLLPSNSFRYARQCALNLYFNPIINN